MDSYSGPPTAAQVQQLDLAWEDARAAVAALNAVIAYFQAPAKTAIEDYARIFYLLEGLCWTHRASRNEETRPASRSV